MRKFLFKISAFLFISLLFTACGKTPKAEIKAIKDYTVSIESKTNIYDSLESKNEIYTAEPSEILKILDYTEQGLKIEIEKPEGKITGWIEYSEIFFPGECFEILLKPYLQKNPFAQAILNKRVYFDMTLEQANSYIKEAFDLVPAEEYAKLDPEQDHDNIFRIIDIIFHSSFWKQVKNNTTNPFHFFYEYANKKTLSYYKNPFYFSCLLYNDSEGRSRLMHAILGNNYDAVKYLYDIKADIYAKDNEGHDVAYYVQNCKNQEIKNLLTLAFNLPEITANCQNYLKEHQSDQDIKAIHFLTYEVPYTLWNRATVTGSDIRAAGIEDFKEFLAIAEAKFSENYNSAENILSNKSDTAYVFMRSENNFCEYDSNLNIRNEPGKTGISIGKLPYGTRVQVLESSEDQDTIDGVTDYWYKVCANEIEGWCFGGFLAYPLRGTEFELADRDHTKDICLTQLSFKENKSYTVIKNTEIFMPDGTKYPVNEFEQIEILKAFNPSDEDFYKYKKNYYNEDLEQFYEYETLDDATYGKYFSRYPFYLVRNSKNQVGIISGSALAHSEVHYKPNNNSSKENDKIWYASYKTDNYTYLYADIYEKNTKLNSIRKYQTGEAEGIGFNDKPFYVGQIPYIYSNAASEFNKLLEKNELLKITDLQNYTLKAYDYFKDQKYDRDVTVYIFASTGFTEMGKATVYNLYTVDKKTPLAFFGLNSAWSYFENGKEFMKSIASLDSINDDSNSPKATIMFYGSTTPDWYGEYDDSDLKDFARIQKYKLDSDTYLFELSSDKHLDKIPEF